MNPNLPEAVAIFKELGWEAASAENIMTLPLGTAEQKRAALSGLKSGEFGEIVQIKEGSYGWRSHFDVNECMLALFAVRVGVNAQRAANILCGPHPELLVDVIAARGAKYASDFIKYACVSRWRPNEHSSSRFGNAVVRLVDRLNLDVPDNVEYIKDWSVYAAAALGLKAETDRRETSLPDPDLIAKNFTRHVITGVAVNTPATGPFGEVLPAGVKRGWLDRAKAVELIFSALDAAIRPGDRKVWLDALDKLDVGAGAFNARAQSLIPVLSSGDATVVARLAPGLIATARDSLLTEILLASFSATSKKARQLVLKAALDRPKPEDAASLAPWLAMFAADSDKTVSALALRLARQWAVDAECAAAEKAEPRGFWQNTPPVWKLPDFEMGEASPEILTGLAAGLVNSAALVHDIHAERFLAVANAVAYQNPGVARASLRGVRQNGSFFNHIADWVKKETPGYGHDKTDRHDGTTATDVPATNAAEITPPLTGSVADPVADMVINSLADPLANPVANPVDAPLNARDYIVCLNLEKLPCLLSTPSRQDMSISVPDLAARLARYKKSGVEALEADLFLALTRLDSKTATQDSIKVLKKLDIPVVLQSGEKLSATAGQAVLAYLDNPLKEPPMSVDEHNQWRRGDICAADSLPGFPDRFSGYCQNELFSMCPFWGDAALQDVRWDSEVYHEKGLVLRQVARRGTPLPAGAAINLLAAQRSTIPDAAADSALAVIEAWERGLLQPGVADIALLDWSASDPSNLAALAAALDGIAREGLLSVVWPILDSLVAASLRAPRLLAGTAELVDLISVFLPEVEFAVEKGLADKSALYLEGVRALALRGGTSRAASAAKKVSALLPPLPHLPGPRAAEADSPSSMRIPFAEADSPSSMRIPFDELWPAQKNTATLIEDGVTVSVDWADTNSPTRLFLFTLKLPNISDRVFQVVKDWYYDLEYEGQCQAYAAEPGAISFTGNEQNQAWLHWDAKQQAMVAHNKRNWAKDTEGPLEDVEPTPLSASLLTVIIGLLAQDGEAAYFAPDMLKNLLACGGINAEMTRRATRTLLKYPVISPAKLARSLEKNSVLLPALWPILTECIKLAGAIVAEGNSPPVWINRILDISSRYSGHLAEAAKRGFIPTEDARWTGLSQLAASKTKSTAVAKAQKLLALLA